MWNGSTWTPWCREVSFSASLSCLWWLKWGSCTTGRIFITLLSWGRDRDLGFELVDLGVTVWKFLAFCSFDLPSLLEILRCPSGYEVPFLLERIYFPYLLGLNCRFHLSLFDIKNSTNLLYNSGTAFWNWGFFLNQLGSIEYFWKPIFVNETGVN